MSEQQKQNLVINPQLEIAEGADPTAAPAAWEFQAPRTEISPNYCRHGADAAASLVIEGNGDRQAIGHWGSKIELEAYQWYRASVRVRWSDIENPHISIFARAAQRFLVPAGTEQSGGALSGPWPQELVLERTFYHDPRFISPYFAGDTFECYLKASANGRVEFSEPVVERVDAPQQRTARVATIRFGNSEPLTSETQRQRIIAKLDQAGALKPDIVALPEFTPLCGIPEDQWNPIENVAETVPDGPICGVLSAAAKRHNMYVLAGIVERRGKHVFNTGVIFDRQGNFLGQYDKTHLTFMELSLGVSCGESYPIFDLDFGRIAVHICYDEWFPEVARYFAHQGAEILFLPVAGGKPITWRTRALDNRIYFVSSSITPPSMIIDSSGAIIAETHGDGIAVADLNLDDRQTNVYGDPTLSNAMPYIAPQMRHCIDDSLLEDLHDLMVPGTATCK